MQLLIRLAILIPFLLLSPISFAGIGKVTKQTGPAEIQRNKKSLESKIDVPVEMNDTFVTAKSKAELTFEDNTKVNITEQSKLVIDDFVYDNKKGAGKLAMRVALGTVRYASGQIAKTNPQNVGIKTPTATIAVRGTDFSMTVDELGRSLVMLLPSCDNKGCVTGVIEVSNGTGSVTLDAAYQATLVATIDTPPTSPVIVNIDQFNINNMLIITPPKEIERGEDSKIAVKNVLDVSGLDVDLLKYVELDKNALEDYKELDVDLLGANILFNFLDVLGNTLNVDVLSAESRLLPNFNPAAGWSYFYNDDKSKVTVCQKTTHNACITSSVDEDKTININQLGIELTQLINRGGKSIITIQQSN